MLALRPTNAASRLPQGSRVCILNPRDVYRALAQRRAIVPSVSLHVPFALPAVLRAARDLDAVLGLSGAAARRAMGHEVQVASPYAQFGRVADAAAETNTDRPLFLVGMLPIDAADPRTVAAAREVAFKFVDAGFTGVAVRPPNDPAESVADLVADIGAPLRDRELALEVVVSDPPDPARLSALAGTLKAKGAAADVFAVRLDGAPSSAAVGALARAARPAALAGYGVDRPAAGLAAAGLRRFDLTRALFDVAAPALPSALVAEVHANPDPGPALASHAVDLTREVARERAERIEALAYAEALGLIRALGAHGTGRAVVEFLSTRSGY